jgi:hypothetical protein
MEVICINDRFSDDWNKYFQHWGIVKPVAEKIYTIREIVPNTKGEKGLLLVEIVNKPTPRVSPLTGMKGNAEQNWAISRFTTLLGEPLNKEKLSEIIKQAA